MYHPNKYHPDYGADKYHPHSVHESQAVLESTLPEVTSIMSHQLPGNEANLNTSWSEPQLAARKYGFNNGSTEASHATDPPFFIQDSRWFGTEKKHVTYLVDKYPLFWHICLTFSAVKVFNDSFRIILVRQALVRVGRTIIPFWDVAILFGMLLLRPVLCACSGKPASPGVTIGPSFLRAISGRGKTIPLRDVAILLGMSSELARRGMPRQPELITIEVLLWASCSGILLLQLCEDRESLPVFRCNWWLPANSPHIFVKWPIPCRIIALEKDGQPLVSELVWLHRGATMKWMKSLFSGLGMLPDEEVPNNFPLVLATRWRASETINKYLLLRGQLTVALQWGRHGQNYPAGGPKIAATCTTF